MSSLFGLSSKGFCRISLNFVYQKALIPKFKPSFIFCNFLHIVHKSEWLFLTKNLHFKSKDSTPKPLESLTLSAFTNPKEV